MSTEFAIKVDSSCSRHNCMMVNYKYSIGFKNIHDLIFDTSYKNDHRFLFVGNERGFPEYLFDG